MTTNGGKECYKEVGVVSDAAVAVAAAAVKNLLPLFCFFVGPHSLFSLLSVSLSLNAQSTWGKKRRSRSNIVSS